MTLLMLENKEKTFLLEQKKDQTEEINQLKEQLDREKKEQLNEIEKLKNELEKEKNKGFFARLFGKQSHLIKWDIDIINVKQACTIYL